VILVLSLSNIRLTNNLSITLLTIIIGIVISITIVIINGSFGVFFIEFNETNPAKIASGPGGLLTAIFSLFYIGISLLIFFQPLSKYIRYILQGISLNLFFIIRNSLIIFLFFSLIIDFFFIFYGMKRIKYVGK
jgi:hypothetical protein